MNLEYQTMRTFADSWGMLFMLLFFALVIVRVMSPSAKKMHDDAANIPFKEQ